MKFKLRYLLYVISSIAFIAVFFIYILPFLRNPLGLPERLRTTGSMEESKSCGAFLWEYHVDDLETDDDTLRLMLQMKEVYLEKERWWRPSYRDYVVVDSSAVLVMRYGDKEREPVYCKDIRMHSISPEDFRWSSANNFGAPIPPATLVFPAKRDSTYKLKYVDTLNVVFQRHRDMKSAQMRLVKVK